MGELLKSGSLTESPTAQPRNGAENFFAVNQPPSVAAGYRTTILQTCSIICPAIPHACAPAAQTYRIILQACAIIRADARVGQWSDVVSISVAG